MNKSASGARAPWGLGASLLVIGMALGATSAQAQDASGDEEIVVTGIRAALRSAIQAKRGSAVQIDQINAEDIADFPDSNIAESIQRLPGVSIDRDNGEGRTLVVRGLGADFTSVQINGMDAQSTSGPEGGNAQTNANRTRGFDFNTFASDLFDSIEVQKTASASTDEGSLGAVVSLNTGRPLELEGRTLAMSLEGAHYEKGGATTPRIAALVSDTFFDNRLGVLASVAYSERESEIDSYDRNVGGFEVVYRNSQLAGVSPNTYGFARPTDFVGANAASSCLGFPGRLACGSDPVAYAQLNPEAIFPALATLTHQEISYERLGTTLTLQWRPTDRTDIIIDGLYSEYFQDTELFQVVPVGLNRNLYNNTAATNPGSLSQTARRNLYPFCTQSATNDCGQTLFGTSPVDFDGPGGQPAAFNSWNPNNLDPYDYYNWVQSPGFISHPNGIANWAELVGRPNSEVRDVHTTTVNGTTYIDYLALDNVDWRNAADGTNGEVYFSQASVNLDHEFTDRFRVHGLYGQSRSQYKNIGFLVEFNTLDSDGYIYDERGGADMPVMDLGFNAADPNNWDTVKGFSAIRVFSRTVVNRYETAKLDFSFDLNPDATLNFGIARRIYDFAGSQDNRNNDTRNPTLLEAGLNIEDMGKLVTFGDGLDVPAGTTTSWFAPTIAAFNNAFDIDCGCINEWGDWRQLSNNGARNEVTETSTSYYLEATWNTEIGGNDFFGNVGVRQAKTEIESSGFLSGVKRTAEHEYDDFLPSLNLAYEFLPDMLLRFSAAQVMSRPFLANLTPGGSMNTGTCTLQANGQCTTDQSVSIGNPFLDPFRADNYDLGFEWYFAEDGLFSAAVFHKEIASFPQTVRSSGELSDALQGSVLDEVVAGLNASLQSHVANGGAWNIVQQRDSPGGYIQGYELSFQTAFFFLPAPFDNFGVQANYTHLDSELTYIINPTTGATATAPYLNASPDAINATLYYETDNWQARVSAAQREEYRQLFPLLAGACNIGLTTNNGGPCNAPLLPDFRAVESSLILDASFRYDVNDHISFTLEAQNLTDENRKRWAYQDVQFSQQYLNYGRILTFGLRLKN